ncbi:MAG: RluA family pseudouridine synthase [Bacteroides sp.]|nr:RluA family pseudouridine synthase [Eubacterium sp.]MCM1419010.1 RluA family pseudouridine synthase [Roseburia sp.]MCM1462868.1 RluA family pseudouridine synthase [Bacteroides sp.]
MRTFHVNKNDAGQRLDRFLSKACPALSSGLIFKLLRKKDIKINGKRAEGSARLAEGDVVSVYVSDALFAEREKTARDLSFAPITILYEDENILLVDKPVGLVVHEDDERSPDTLIDRIKGYLYQKGEYRPEEENSFAPSLCNRIDRNTGGIVIAAKNAESLRVLNRKLRDRELTKLYLCAVRGTPEPREATKTAYLFKNEKENRVVVSERKTPKNRTIVTKYRVLETYGGNSLLEVDLLTGRTHQIRAHMAYLGYPLLGDGKYGDNRLNKSAGYRVQALYSYKLRFAFRTDGGILSYLDGREFTAENIWFLEKFRKSGGNV